MKNKYVFVLVLLLGILAVSFGFTNIYVSQNQPAEEEEFVVVTSFYPMYIATMNVIGDTEGVTLKNLSEPQTGCLHDFQLTPADMKLLSTADVFVINGGGIESFMEDIAVQYPDLILIEACADVELLCEEEAHEHEHEASHDDEVDDGHHHDVNAHAWMSVANYRKQVETIAGGLAEAKPESADAFFVNADRYDEELAKLQEEQESLLASAKGEAVIMFHCAYDYLAEDLELEVAFCMDLDEERQVSAGEVAEVLEVIEEHDVKYIFAEELYGSQLCEMIQNEANVEVIYLDPLNRGEYEVDSYIVGMRKNLELIYEVFE